MMKRSIYRLLLILLLAGMQGRAKAQLVAAIDTRFQSFTAKNVQEKIFAHTDREFYLAGDLVWFKLFLVDGAFHKPLDLSKVAYVELLDASNKPVVQTKLSMKDGEGDGSFFVPVSVSSGYYSLRAYTNWMKNTGADYFFQKSITIVNPQISLPPTVVQVNAMEPDIRFFPEGGHLVNGIAGKVACKMTAPDGRELAFSAAVTDENNNHSIVFQSVHGGIGSFSFTPEAGHKYNAIITTTDGKKFTRSLPAADNEGFGLHVSESGPDKLLVHAENNTGATGGYLLVHTRQILRSASQVSFSGGKAEIQIDKNKLGDGITTITLFNAARQPVCERLYFKFPDNPLRIYPKTPQAVYETRNKIDLDLKALRRDDPVNDASLSVSVFRVDSLDALPDENISSYLLLSSDLKGNIENPSWYFDFPPSITAAAIDNLMLTHGWRRFGWDQVLQDKEPVFHFVPEYNGHIITGKIVDKTGRATANIPGFLSVPGKRTQFYPSVSDSKGQVRFEMKDMIGSSEIVVQTNTQQDSLYKLEIDNPFASTYRTTPNPAFQFSRRYTGTLVSKSIGTQVQNIYTAQQRQQFRFPQLDSMPFYGKADATYYLDKYTRFITLEEVLREYVAYLDVQRSRGKFNISLFDFTASQGLIPTKQVPLFPTNPLVLLDGVPIFDVTRLMALDARKIRKLDIFNHRQFVRGQYFDGVLNWQTYNGDLADLELDPGALALEYEGLQARRIFYSPVYDTEDKRSTHLPDFRNLLYWSPGVRTDAKGAAKLSFYSSDLKGKYAVVVQGLSKDGVGGSGVSFFEVR
ncbi:MAG: hypothetical protein JO301_12990 [Chitinophagaceae bacterium]|nr:hypothetical protein [Chitinophagaceae bacterium]